MPFTRIADHRVMPWKDGGGVTTELAIDPPGATVQGPFRWRLSMARVERSGPFSRFPGMDRSLLLVEGEGLDLSLEGRTPVRLQPGGLIARFPGEAQASGHLPGGPVLDFNVISDRGTVAHRLARIILGKEPLALEPGALCLLYVLSGALQVERWGRLDARELLRADGEAALRLRAEGQAEFLAVWIEDTLQG